MPVPACAHTLLLGLRTFTHMRTHIRTHTYACARTHTRARARTHTHTHTKCPTGWLERHLYTVPLKGGEVVQITKEPGMHNVIIDHQRQLFVDQYSSATLPFRVNVCSLADGSVVRSLFVNKVSRQS